jgi:hypothetical protein
VVTDPDLFATELTRWYGLVLLILTGILVMALMQRTFHLLRIVLMVNLPGDLLQIALAIHMAQMFSQWTPALMFTIVFCLLLFIARVAVLLKPQLAGYD